MNNNERTEEIYKKYFASEVTYSTRWKDKVFETLQGKKRLPLLKPAVSLVLTGLLLILGMNLYRNYSFMQEKNRIKEMLLSENAFNYVVSENIGTLVSSYLSEESLGENQYEDATLTDIYQRTKESLYDYLVIYNNLENGDKARVIEKAVNEATEKYIDYFDENLEQEIM
ncbi:MAG: hypothetical protein JW827_05065 [Spirochaetes bacterium]|nr:hypothetical protein [Spirochaetota bacterium]